MLACSSHTAACILCKYC